MASHAAETLFARIQAKKQQQQPQVASDKAAAPQKAKQGAPTQRLMPVPTQHLTAVGTQQLMPVPTRQLGADSMPAGRDKNRYKWQWGEQTELEMQYDDTAADDAAAAEATGGAEGSRGVSLKSLLEAQFQAKAAAAKASSGAAPPVPAALTAATPEKVATAKTTHEEPKPMPPPKKARTSKDAAAAAAQHPAPKTLEADLAAAAAQPAQVAARTPKVRKEAPSASAPSAPTKPSKVSRTPKPADTDAALVPPLSSTARVTAVEEEAQVEDVNIAGRSEVAENVPAAPAAAELPVHVVNALGDAAAEVANLRMLSTASDLTDVLLDDFQLLSDAAAGEDEESKHTFRKLLQQHGQKIIGGLERVAQKVQSEKQAAESAAREAAPTHLLREARATASQCGRMCEQVMRLQVDSAAGQAWTLEEELTQFDSWLKSGCFGLFEGLDSRPSFCADELADAAEDMWKGCGGLQSYATYLQDAVNILGADVQLDGGAAWQRLLVEVQVALELAHLRQEDVFMYQRSSVQMSGSLLGLQKKLLFAVSFVPLQRRVRYVVARVLWALTTLKMAATRLVTAEQFKQPYRGFASSAYRCFGERSSFAASRSAESHPIVREIVSAAFDRAVAATGEKLLADLEAGLMAGCQSPEVLLRQGTASGHATFLAKLSLKAEDRPSTGDRVRDEICQRDSVQLAAAKCEHGDSTLGVAFQRLKSNLASQAVAFADSALQLFCRRGLDEAAADSSLEDSIVKTADAGYAAKQVTASILAERQQAIQRCVTSLRGAAAACSDGLLLAEGKLYA
eukprot:TRINITY_DN5491_c0_g1_i1.p1 TRINITY_DN5491_c0_g1~~TRINITY_DN5491_c0_g1_i1.p1  ORF type:complete len:816 (-),score=250.87 TRINITY_DN5491_c0_g1_i1:332-2716(-)